MTSTVMSKALLLLLLVGTGCGPVDDDYLPTTRVVATGPMRRFPFAFHGRLGVHVAYSQHEDAYVPPADAVDAVTRIGGATAAQPAFYLSSVVDLEDRLLGVSYAATTIDDTHELVHAWTSLDGDAWSPRPSVLTTPRTGLRRPGGWGGILFHRRLHFDDGAIVGTAYGNYIGDDYYRTVWVRSGDLGSSWEVVSTVASGKVGTEGYGEPVSARCPNGEWVVVMRSGYPTPLYLSRSFDAGTTWTAPYELDFVGWDPDLLVIDNDLYLSFGNPGFVDVERSRDCGRTWELVHHDSIQTTSGYTGMALEDSRLWLYFDSHAETAIEGQRVDR